MFNLGYVHLHQNHVARAAKLFRDALTEYRAEKDDGGIAYCLTGFAAVAATRRDANRFAELYEPPARCSSDWASNSILTISSTGIATRKSRADD